MSRQVPPSTTLFDIFSAIFAPAGPAATDTTPPPQHHQQQQQTAAEKQPLQEVMPPTADEGGDGVTAPPQGSSSSSSSSFFSRPLVGRALAACAYLGVVTWYLVSHAQIHPMGLPGQMRY